MYQTSNSKLSNRERILACIFRNPSISRTGIAQLTGITPATVSHTIFQLQQEQLVFEAGHDLEDSSSAGRKRVSLDIRPEYAAALGLEFTKKTLTACVTNLKGKVLYQYQIPYSENLSLTITETIIQVLQMVLKDCGIPLDSFCGIGIGVPGHVTEKGTFVINSSNIWQTFDANKIRDAFSLPVVFENNVRCMALGQYLFHPDYTPENFAFFHVGAGMFCANIVDGSLFTGHTFISGEIGHIIANPNGLRCECGKQGCLQTVASESWLIKTPGSCTSWTASGFSTDWSPLRRKLPQKLLLRLTPLGMKRCAPLFPMR